MQVCLWICPLLMPLITDLSKKDEQVFIMKSLFKHIAVDSLSSRENMFAYWPYLSLLIVF